MKCFIAAVFMTLCAATANASIIYDVDRTIGTGTVTGYITTNGNTEGFLTQDEIEDWSLTLTPETGVTGTITSNPSSVLLLRRQRQNCRMILHQRILLPLCYFLV